MFKPGPKFIAEIGQNHNGSLKTAKRLIDVAAKAGAYAVKSAKRDPGAFLESWKSKPYVGPNSFGATYWDHRMALELSHDDYAEMGRYAKSKGLLFGSSFTDQASLDWLLTLDCVDFLKIASQRVVDVPLLEDVACAKLPVILSTGMSTGAEVEQAIALLRSVPYLAVMQCTSAYPTKLEDLHLSVLVALGGYSVPLGYSFHTSWYQSCLVALGAGAEWFEGHITLDQRSRGTDHVFSLEPGALVECIRLLDYGWAAYGSEREKRLLDCELPARAKLRDDLNAVSNRVHVS